MRVILIRDGVEIVGATIANDDEAPAVLARVQAANRFGYVIHNVIADTAEATIEYLASEEKEGEML